MTLSKLLREPLVWFVLLGAVLIGVDTLRVSAGANTMSDTIRVDRAALIGELKRRTRNYDPVQAAARLDAMNAGDRARLAAEFVNGEILYREAVGLGLDRQDALIRQRLIDRMEALTPVPDVETLNETDLRAWFEANVEAYREPARISFTHALFPDAAGAEAALFDEEAWAQSRPFAFQRRYVLAGHVQLADHFGTDFADAIFEARAAPTQSVIASDHGWHAVVLDQIRPERVPPFEEVSDLVARDIARANVEDATDAALETLRSRYRIVTVEDGGAGS